MTGISMSWPYECIPYEETNAFAVASNPTDVLSEGVVAALQEGDLVIGNLEAPITETFYTEGFPEQSPRNLTSPPETIELLHQGGVDVLNLANNHILDEGRELQKSV